MFRSTSTHLKALLTSSVRTTIRPTATLTRAVSVPTLRTFHSTHSVLQAKEDPVVSFEELQNLVEGKVKKDYVLIDVREPFEVFESGVIPTAKHIPVANLFDALRLDPETFKTTYGFSKPSQSDQVIFYCRSGRRSGIAFETANQLGFKR
ncbi:Uncharacterized protein HK097_000964 [Rhizophlyctis rosea]|uniref:Rhodanese domain-containing protein n=1 Tax=Rhizophlyctis rosea TaxID=64517 RepID=A0AAD5S744_9FUNG|nr:Uncharacterized protein HK097_000964 [Rhizophlyctis rosea]